MKLQPNNLLVRKKTSITTPKNIFIVLLTLLFFQGVAATRTAKSTSGSLNWSSASSWQNNNKPTNGDDVVIPSGSTVILDENVNVKSITINGTLKVDYNKNITVNTAYIMVMGSNAVLEWGTESNLYTKRGIITLTGNDKSQKIPGTSIESKGIVAMNGASIFMHGLSKKTWTKLASSTTSGQNTIQLSESATNWQVGDEVVITSSRLNWNEAEKRTITSISADRKTITLNSALNHPHSGFLKNYTRPNDGKTWATDLRAEVGLLSKNITIRGDQSSDGSNFGGHVMIHGTAKAYISNVEFFRMGQTGILGRYPFHWHLVQENGNGQYIKDCSIHKSFNRAITIHGTESALVENNFCYDHIGHGIFLEDGSERFNIIRGNVVLLTKRPQSGDELTPSDNQFNEVQNRTPASYWITNPNNIFENNVAAGTQGTGFWFAMPTSPMGPSANIPRFQNLEPHKQPLGKFYGNTAHSCKSGFDIFDQLDANHSILRNRAWQRTDRRVMEACTWYANNMAVYGGIGGGRAYTENVVFSDNVFADNETALMHANYSTVDQSLFIANTGENIFSGERKLNRGYDGACTIKNCHLVGWQASNANYVQNTGGAQKHVNYRVSGITTDHNGPPRISFPDYSIVPKGDIGANSIPHPRFWSYVHWDMDGSLGGKANTSIITNHPLCRDGSEVRYENWDNIYRTDRRFAYLIIDAPGDPKMTIVRTKSGTPKAGQYYINGFYGTFIHFPVIVNDGFLYTAQFESLGTGKNVRFDLKDDYIAGDEALFRIKDFGRLPGVSISNANKLSSLNAVKNSNSSAWAIVGDDVYLKMVSVSSTPDISCRISWTQNINLPVLDTDGDGISDADESQAGTDPIPNGPIPENPVLTITPNQKPSVSFASPQNGDKLLAGSDVRVTVNASDSDGGIANIRLYINEQFIRQENHAPYEWNHDGQDDPLLRNLAVGNYTLRAVATDSDGATNETSITINVANNDCEGVLGGNALPGTSCNDGDPCTINDAYDANCNCVGELVVPEVTTTVTNETCSEPGSIRFAFADVATRTNIEFSIDGGASYPLNVADDAGTAAFNDLAPGTYDVWARWGNDQCPVSLGEHTIAADPAPAVTVSTTDAQGTSNNGKITFSFDDTPRYRIEFSMDGGATYPLNVLDNVGSASFENVAVGTYDVWVRWGNNDCPVDLGQATVNTSASNTCDIIPYININRNGWNSNSTATVNESDEVWFGPQSEEFGTVNNGWSWTGPNGFTSSGRELLIGSIATNQGGAYTVTNTDQNGCTASHTFTITVEAVQTEDCAGVAGGSATIDGCGICSGGTTGITPSSPSTWYADTDGDGIGDANNSVEDCEQPGGYGATAGDQCPADGNKTTPGECGCGVAEGSCTSNGPILGPDCASANGTASFELATSYRENATSYSWWLQGSASSMSSPVGQPYKTTISFSQYFDGGEVCVGVNFSAAPYYTSYCKQLSECTGTDASMANIDATIYPNPAESRSIAIETSANAGAIEQVSVQDGAGNTIYQSSDIQDGDSIDLSGVSQGTYYLKIITANGVVTKTIVLL